MVDNYINTFPSHYSSMLSVLNLCHKACFTKNRHLVDNSYYDHYLLFHNFLSQLRICNPKNCVGWAIVATALLYSHGSLLLYFHRGTYCGMMSLMKTFLAHTSDHVKNQNSSINNLLRHERVIVSSLHNNQHGYGKIHQRNGESNCFIKVTGQFFKN